MKVNNKKKFCIPHAHLFEPKSPYIEDIEIIKSQWSGRSNIQRIQWFISDKYEERMNTNGTMSGVNEQTKES